MGTLEQSAPGNEPINPCFRPGQRVHAAGDVRRIGTVKYMGPLEGHSGIWVGVDWDNDGDGKHDGSHNGFRYFQARGPKTGSFVRPGKLSSGITLLEALELRYKSTSTKEEEDEMYVLSATNRRVSVEILGREKIQSMVSNFEDMTGASLAFLGVSSPGPLGTLVSTLPNLKELDLMGNLLSDWKDVGIICKELAVLEVLNLSYNLMSHDVTGFPKLNNIRVLVLNFTGISWNQVEALKESIPHLEELHLMGNHLQEITPSSSINVEGFDFLRLLNFEENCFADWNEILKLSQLKSLEQLLLNKNNLDCIWYPESDALGEEATFRPFEKLSCLLIGGNNIKDLTSVDSLNHFPNLMDVRLSENPITDTTKDGVPRYVLIARLANIKILNGSQISQRERKDSEIRYVRLVMMKSNANLEDISRLHPRFSELKTIHGIDEVRAPIGRAGPQKMSSGLISINLKCIGPTIGEKAPLTKKLPPTTTVGKLKNLCESFFKLYSIKPKLFLQEEFQSTSPEVDALPTYQDLTIVLDPQGCPLPTLLDDDMASLIDIGVGNESTILVDEEN
ncbi:OLC1v1018487C1 [Oldenlandia corymbosa var. corymbosa]|uniref:OLC1v1018487C1 n=1 Tax=Oldenlandia corymbosa var. corymbosa TaxID=529605 RepID=A0AAV1EBW3_OLDCO|nr:OLC1v1018487C1 [Oldenlandia corymbosa var. corymbosa]